MSFFGLFGNPSHDQFVKLLLREASKAGAPTDFEYNKEAFTLKRGKTLMNLGNLYQVYSQAKRDDRHAVLANMVGSMIAAEANKALTFDEAKDRIVAVVRERAMLAQGSLWWQLEFDEPSAVIKTAHEPFSDWFTKALAIDYPTRVTLVTNNQLQEWGITFDEMWAFGLQRLREWTVPKFEREGGVFRSAWNDDYDASRVLLPELFHWLELDGEPVIVLPNRTTLLVAGSNDLESMRTMLEKGEQLIAEKPRPYNPSPLVLRNGELCEFQVDEHSPIFNEVQRARRIAPLSHYNDQKKQLEKLYEKKGKDLFVCSYALTKYKSNKHVSHVTWSKGAPSLLAVADVVMFYDDEAPGGGAVVGRARWADVLARLGDLMLDTKMFPARYYVSEFPTAEQLAALGKATLD